MIWLLYLNLAGAAAGAVCLLIRAVRALLRSLRTPTIVRSGGR